MSTAILSLLVAIGAGMVGTASLVVAARRRPPDRPAVTVGDLLVALAVAALAWALGQAAARRWGAHPVGFFQALSYLYLAAVLAAPMVATAALVVGRVASRAEPARPVDRRVAALAVAVLPLAPAGLWCSRVEPQRLHVEEVSLDLASVDGDAIRIGVVADIQTVRIGSRERRAVGMVEHGAPDLVLFAGDVFQGTQAQAEDAWEPYRSLFARLGAAPSGALLVGGNVDDPATLRRWVDGTGTTFLDVEEAHLEVRGTAVEVLGLPLEPDEASVAVLAEFAGRPRDGTVRIVLVHHPDWIFELPTSGSAVDLVVAGHTHGGQLQLPLLGPPLILSSVPRSVGAGGLHELRGHAIYVSTGVGMEQQGAPQVRFLARPSVGMIELR